MSDKAKKTVSLTTRGVEGLKPRDRRYEAWIAGKPGFGVRVSPFGVKSWIYLYRFEGKPRRMTIGTYPQVNVKEAHREYNRAELALKDGIDPGKEKTEAAAAERTAETVSELAEDYFASIKNDVKSFREIKRAIEKDVLPRLGRKKAKDITRRNIKTICDDISERGSPIQAKRTLAYTRGLFEFGVDEELFDVNPCVSVKLKIKEVSRQRTLDAREIKAFWNGLDSCKMSEQVKLALRLQLVTAQRKGEVVTMEKSEVSREDAIWTIPAQKAKNGSAHRVPLTDLAMDIINLAFDIDAESKWVFPSPANKVDKRHITASSVNHALNDNLDVFEFEENFTPHDLRRTAASMMTSNGISRFDVKRVLNHKDSDVTAAYDRYSYDKEIKQALELWSGVLSDMILDNKKSDNVVKLEERKR